MQLSEFSLTTAQMEAGEVFKALETVISEERIQQAIEATQSQAERQRRLPTQLVVALVIGMSLWSQESIVDVLKNLADGALQPMDSIGAMVANSEQISN